ncbi:MAG: tetratricopeptide repeat protein [Deltaproteobacteria bacterium]|nr:tetratricopeptide repeat protein [Deltaproteobacteria bacterium]
MVAVAVVAGVLAAGGGAWWLLSARGRAADAAAAAGQRQLFEVALLAAHEPRAPAACRTKNRATLEALAEAAGRLAGGAPRSGRPQDLEAVTRLEAARESAGSAAEYWYLLGRALLFAGREAASVEEVAKKALEACPDFAAAHNLSGTAGFVSGRDQEALGHYERAVALDRGYVTPRVNRALVLLRQKRVQEALHDLDVVVKEAPGHPDALLVRGQALLLDGAAARALPDLEASVRLAPGNSAAHLLLGEAYSREQRHDEAQAAFCRAKALGNRNAAARCQDDGGAARPGAGP